MKPSPWNSKRLQVGARGLRSPLGEIEVVGVRADAVSMPDDQNVRVRVLGQTVGKLLEIGSAVRQDFGRVEWEKDARREGHCDSFADARNRRARNFLLELLRLLVHLMADDRARRATDDRANDGAACG